MIRNRDYVVGWHSLGRRICAVLRCLQISWRNIGQQPFNESAYRWYRSCKKEKASKMPGIFSRAQSSLTMESANRFLKSIILPVLDYCGAVFHRCGKGNEEGLECLQRWAGRIVLNTALFSTKQMCTSLSWDTLTKRRENHIVKLAANCLKGMAPSYFSKYFNLKDIMFMTMTLGIRTS